MLSALLLLLPVLALASPVTLADRQEKAVYIKSHRDGKCLHVDIPRGYPNAGFGDGREVGSVPCDKALTQWFIQRGSGTVRHALSDKALDAGENPANGGELKLWTSYPGLFQQTWYYTDDNRIAITGGKHCLDESENGQVQLWECTTGNTNQIWYLTEEGGPKPV